MKKIISTVLAGAVMLSLSACSEVFETIDTSVPTVTTRTTTQTTTATTTTQATTTETTEEYVMFEQDEYKSFDELIPSDGEIFMDFEGKPSADIAENILKVLRIRTNTPIESYVKRFEIPPEYTYEDGVWSFYWDDENMPETNTFIILEITAGNEDGKIVLDQNSSVHVKCYMMDDERCGWVYERIADEIQWEGESHDYLKGGLAINPRCSGHNFSYTGNYQGFTYIRSEIDIKCNIPPLTDEDWALINGK